ncbi:MAG: hypothetical protein ACXVRZ_06330 [Gaiellaceae bacterium]
MDTSGFDQYAASLAAVLGVPRAVRNGAEITSVLSIIARVVSEALGFETVVMNIYRPEWDDFYVAAVHGSDAVRAALLGSVDDWGKWKPLLHPQFRHAGAYFIPRPGVLIGHVDSLDLKQPLNGDSSSSSDGTRGRERGRWGSLLESGLPQPRGRRYGDRSPGSSP